MKQHLLTIVLSAAALQAVAQEKFILNGEIGHYNAPAYGVLNYVAGTERRADTFRINDGKFSVSGSVPKTVKATYFISPTGNGRYYSMESGNVFLEAGTIALKSPDVASNARMSGTPMNDGYQQYLDAMRPLALKRDTVQMVYSNAIAKLNTEKVQQLKQFIAAHPESPVVVTLVNDYLGQTPSLEQLDSAFQTLSATAKSSSAGKEMAAKIKALKAITVGQMAPEFSQQDTAGVMVHLKDFRGKYVLLDFWASWCVPCRAENPHVVEAFNRYKDKNFTVLGVSLDREKDKAAWLNAIHEDGLTWTQVSDLHYWQNAVSKLYSIQAIPANFLIDPQGRIIATNLRGEALGKKLAEVLK
ncbi:AhpC/TSA family protein [Chitinophaga horti]|uniref:AhpC/TSA family protein n=1 Tax=Chitinophaga horti TaxID=2920382 RepID=A0ABY6J4A7_9BACT|nr:TlpA disulfide reductase family protein [Chitinophaga horti]UYQ94506.1 AhpC/TSA family protein [Chitinophaga horti]